jgi:UPF0755 protein
VSGPQPPQPRSGQRVGIVEGWEIRRARQRDANSGAWKGLLFVVVLLIGLVIGGWIVARPVIGPAVTGLFEQNPGILNMPIVADLLRAELGDRLGKPASSEATEVKFVIDPGQTVDEIQGNLVDAGLLTDPLAFKYLIMSDRVDQLLEAGTYTMDTGMSPQTVVTRLAADPDPPTPVVNLALRPGLRIEQIVAYLQAQTEETELSLDPKEFLDLATDPRPEIFDEFPFLRQVSEGNSLEGFLAGGVYPVPIDINADEFLHLLLQEWEEDSGDLVAQARKKGIDFYDALTVASLVEREVKVDTDRAKVAGVYWNRLDPKLNGATGGLMQADPTVVYATDSMALDELATGKWPNYLFWDTLGVADLATVNVSPELQSHQTYQQPGLPDWPIATPTRASIEAALDPDKRKDFLFFYACPGSDTHTFAKTAAQHSRNIAQCEPS